MMPAPTLAVPLTAQELRALAAAHDDYAERASVCDQHVEAAASWNRAEHLRRLAVKVGPPVGDGTGLLWLDVQS